MINQNKVVSENPYKIPQSIIDEANKTPIIKIDYISHIITFITGMSVLIVVAMIFLINFKIVEVNRTLFTTNNSWIFDFIVATAIFYFGYICGKNK
jgi:hypothetical protein